MTAAPVTCAFLARAASLLLAEGGGAEMARHMLAPLGHMVEESAEKDEESASKSKAAKKNKKKGKKHQQQSGGGGGDGGAKEHTRTGWLSASIPAPTPSPTPAPARALVSTVGRETMASSRGDNSDAGASTTAQLFAAMSAKGDCALHGDAKQQFCQRCGSVFAAHPPRCVRARRRHQATPVVKVVCSQCGMRCWQGRAPRTARRILRRGNKAAAASVKLAAAKGTHAPATTGASNNGQLQAGAAALQHDPSVTHPSPADKPTPRSEQRQQQPVSSKAATKKDRKRQERNKQKLALKQLLGQAVAKEQQQQGGKNGKGKNKKKKKKKGGGGGQGLTLADVLQSC
ncbi:hypothetical protein PTSG_08764 [Salpingoeca rosetta]|uniref:Uncharacterized protein n=1 Tax=Salpingoeca rosetta (strain ATCC 50818 / BSB-021) TaxID=946362 RepID=F2UKM3_SALR5|nr:uncharacterized protein PTSG_08764 [Salpingoeca rosetta]EGD77672.1 hypothetical protein PTSG_08764 [Salpingoeca rosetta]|eukprot:XP_004990148.1 hypothetical protein PTSG_08764 [Salpingoeca rosetta]